MPFRLRSCDERACRRRRAPPHPVALAIEPLGELRCRPRDVQPLEQRAAIQCHRAVEVAGRERGIERADVTPERIRHPDLILASPRQHVGAEFPAQEVERPPQRRSGALIVELRPEEGEKGIATMESPRRGDGEVREQPQTLGLPKHGAHFATVWAAEVQNAEGMEADHRCS